MAKDDPARVFALHGGPRNGDKLRLASPPAEWLRLALPEWSTYRWDAKADRYEYVGPEKPPLEQKHSGPRTEPWVTAELTEASFAHRDTDAYRRGRAMADEDEHPDA